MVLVLIKKTYAVFIDAMKAFDTVNHEILLKFLFEMGLRGNVGRWLQNYLTNRKQCTQANGSVSKLNNLTYGVPQESMCGPLLFLLYINDLSNIQDNSRVSLYADDTVIYLSHDEDDVALRLIQDDLNKLQKWCCMRKLTTNCKKIPWVDLSKAEIDRGDLGRVEMGRGEVGRGKMGRSEMGGVK